MMEVLSLSLVLVKVLRFFFLPNFDAFFVKRATPSHPVLFCNQFDLILICLPAEEGFRPCSENIGFFLLVFSFSFLSIIKVKHQECDDYNNEEEYYLFPFFSIFFTTACRCFDTMIFFFLSHIALFHFLIIYIFSAVRHLKKSN